MGRLGGTSAYIGRVYDGFKVVRYYKVNDYKKIYGREIKLNVHNAYNYELYNETTNQHLTLSGNQMRLINSGKRTINQMLNESIKGGKNTKINAYRKWLRSQ